MYIPISKVCSILGVSLSTVYRMLKQGILKESFRTEGNHRRFNVQEIHQIQRKTYEPRVVTYARVSSHDQKDDLTRQSNVLKSYIETQAYKNVTNIEDLGSGLNDKKKGFLKLVQMIFNHEFEILVINHRDRLLRFGVDLMEIICINHGVRLIVLEDKKKSFEEQLTQDVENSRAEGRRVIELMTVFCAKLYGKRSHHNKRKVIVQNAFSTGK